MPNPPEPERGAAPGFDPREPSGEGAAENEPMVPADPETETVVISKHDQDSDSEPAEGQQRERRFTAPGFDAKETAVIATPPEPATEVFPSPPGAAAPGAEGPPTQMGAVHPKAAVPQSIPPRLG